MWTELTQFARRNECPEPHEGLQYPYVQRLRFVPSWLTHRHTHTDIF